jgi:DNA replication protein DnaC
LGSFSREFYKIVHLEFDIMKEEVNKMNEMRNEMRREREERMDSMNENKELNNTNNTNKEVKIMMKFIDIEEISKSIEIITLTELKELIKEYILDNDTLIIWGNYGIGKTQIVNQIVREVAKLPRKWELI